MKTFKKVLRYLVLILLLLLASFGMALSGTLFTNRHQYADRETNTEWLNKKEEDDGEEELTIKSKE